MFFIPLPRIAAGLLLALPPALVLGNAAGDIMLSLVAVIFLAHVTLNRHSEWLHEPWLRVAGIIWLYMLGHALFTDHIAHGLGSAAVWVRFPVFACAAVWLLRGNTALQRKLFYSLGLTLLFMLMDSAVQYATGTSLTGHPTVLASFTTRLTGPYKEPRVGIMLAWLGPPVVAGLLAMGRKQWHTGMRFLMGLGFTCLWLGIIAASGERMALILALLSIVFILTLLAPSRHLTFAFLAVVILGGTALGMKNPELIHRHVTSTLKMAETWQDSHYGALWRGAGNMILANPIFGVGPRQYRYTCTAYMPQIEHPLYEYRCNENLHPHQMYLEWLAELGLVGTGLFLTMIFLWAQATRTRWPVWQHHAVTVGLAAALFIRLWPFSTSTSFFANWSAVPFWFVAGWFLASIAEEIRHDNTALPR